MILGPVSYLDCVVFCIFLALQLVWQAGLFTTIWHAARSLPFLVFNLPITLFNERAWLPGRLEQPAFVRHGATPFEHAVVRCVRHGFVNIPPVVGRVFFSKSVALPFLRFRMLRHGFLRYPAYWREYSDSNVKGIWIVKNPQRRPDFILYFIHGGGFSVGSPYFYLEYLLTWLSLLSAAGSGYNNPAIFALDYTLVPDASFPTQLRQAVGGYRHVLAAARNPSIVCVSGDSAGGALVLSLLLHLATQETGHCDGEYEEGSRDGSVRDTWRPALAILISPWATLISPRHRDSASDYLDVNTLHKYGLQYAGNKVSLDDPLVSPGSCRDPSWWEKASPTGGFCITYGQDEVFASDIRELARTLQQAGASVRVKEEIGGIHAWPVASMFLSSPAERRLRGVKGLVEMIRKQVYETDKRACEEGETRRWWGEEKQNSSD